MRSVLPGADGIAAVVLLASAGIAVVQTLRVPVPEPAAASTRRTSDWPDMRVDLNNATAVELRAIPGIGPRLAERIVADRDAYGAFRSMDDLTRVPHVGPALVRRARPFAAVYDTPFSRATDSERSERPCVHRPAPHP